MKRECRARLSASRRRVSQTRKDANTGLLLVWTLSSPPITVCVHPTIDTDVWCYMNNIHCTLVTPRGPSNPSVLSATILFGGGVANLCYACTLRASVSMPLFQQKVREIVFYVHSFFLLWQCCYSVFLSSHGAFIIGCATGRVAFELTRSFELVMGVDFSTRFIRSASNLQSQITIRYSIVDEGDLGTFREIGISDIGLRQEEVSSRNRKPNVRVKRVWVEPPGG